MFIILLSVWMILNNSMLPEIWISGILVSGILSLIFCNQCKIFGGIRFTPKALLNTVLYLGVFSFELVKSNLDIAKRVLTPSLPINPGVVRVKTTLNSPMARLILANSITLTPGTLTLDIKEDMLYIHFVHIDEDDVEAYAKSIVRKFEKYLEVIYG